MLFTIIIHHVYINLHHPFYLHILSFFKMDLHLPFLLYFPSFQLFFPLRHHPISFIVLQLCIHQSFVW